jgi:hypothetical protein
LNYVLKFTLRILNKNRREVSTYLLKMYLCEEILSNNDIEKKVFLTCLNIKHFIDIVAILPSICHQ